MTTHILVDSDSFIYRASSAGQSSMFLFYEVTDLDKEEFEYLGVVSGYNGTDYQNYEKAGWSVVLRLKEYQEYLDSNNVDYVQCKEVITKPFEVTVEALDRMISRIKSEVEAVYDGDVYYTFYMSDPSRVYFRHHIATIQPYKGDRNAKPTMKHFNRLYDFFVEHYKPKWGRLLEADDMISIKANELRKLGKDYLIVTNDKDLQQIPGTHYNPYKRVWSKVDELSAARVLYEQILSGDHVDHVAGLPKVGKIRASNYLRECTTPLAMERKVTSVYENYNMCLHQKETRWLVELIKDKAMWKERVKPYYETKEKK